MIRAVRISAMLLLALAAPARADDLPFFAGGAGFNLDSPPVIPSWEPQTPVNPWSGLVVGTEMFGAAASGRGARGGFGGDAYVGYYKELDNHIVIGVQGSAGYLPGLYNYGPRGYDLGLAQVKVGYDMGRLMPYVTLGVGVAKPTSTLNGTPSGLDSVNNLFVGSGPTNTVTTVGAGVNYAVTDRLTVGVGVNATQVRGGWGPPLIPQPGMP
jgi:opacity protein-like surface antigen